MGEAMALCVSTSTAVSREIPLFSASNTPSENASICTARLKCQQYAFGKRQHLHRETQIHRDLHGKRQAGLANVSDLGPNVEQQRLHFLKGLAASANHY